MVVSQAKAAVPRGSGRGLGTFTIPSSLSLNPAVSPLIFLLQDAHVSGMHTHGSIVGRRYWNLTPEAWG